MPCSIFVRAASGPATWHFESRQTAYLSPEGDLDRSPEASAATEISGLRKLYEFSQRLMEVKSVSALLDELMDSVIEVTNADKGFLILIEAGRAARGRGAQPEPAEPAARRAPPLGQHPAARDAHARSR